MTVALEQSITQGSSHAAPLHHAGRTPIAGKVWWHVAGCLGPVGALLRVQVLCAQLIAQTRPLRSGAPGALFS